MDRQDQNEQTSKRGSVAMRQDFSIDHSSILCSALN
jgi:hypothetical protein